MEENNVFDIKKNYDKEKIKFLEEHLNEGHTKEELNEMFKQEVIEKDFPTSQQLFPKKN